MQPKVDHLAFIVKDLERSVKFYQDVFGGKAGRSRGFNEKDKNAGRPMHQLVTVGDYGFDLFVEDPADPPKPGARVLHFAFSIEPNEIDQALERLRKLKIPYDGPKVHGGSTSISIYLESGVKNRGFHSLSLLICWSAYFQAASRGPLTGKSKRGRLSVRRSWAGIKR